MPSLATPENEASNGGSYATVPNSIPDRTMSLCEDLVCIGFGPASLAIAVAIHDIFESEVITGNDNAFPSVRFLEKQQKFGWHAGMLLPTAKMQISFIKDLATLRDPTSKFTFLNYLKAHDRLVQFANLNTFLPLRIEFEDYLKWAASHFEQNVDYSQEVLQVKPYRSREGQKFDRLEVASRDIVSGTVSYHFAKNVVIAAGGKPSIPPVFVNSPSRVIHSSQYNNHIESLLPVREKPYHVAVIGSGQSAAEVFDDLHSRYPHARTSLIIRDSALRPSDDSPFVNEVFNPEAVDSFYATQEVDRTEQVRRNKATNYSVVRLTLLEKIYEDLYHQRVTEKNPNNWRHQILTTREVVEVKDNPANKRVNLTVKNMSPAAHSSKEILSVDAVILGTGYKRDAHIEMLNDCSIINGSSDGSWHAGRDYQVQLDRNFVEKDVNIYLQGCNEQTHGLSDSLLSILATRSGEIVRSIFGDARSMTNGMV